MMMSYSAPFQKFSKGASPLPEILKFSERGWF